MDKYQYAISISVGNVIVPCWIMIVYSLVNRCACLEPSNPSNETLQFWEKRNITASEVNWTNLEVAVGNPLYLTKKSLTDKDYALNCSDKADPKRQKYLTLLPNVETKYREAKLTLRNYVTILF